MARPIDQTCHCISLRRIASTITTYYDQTLAPSGLSISQFSLLQQLQRLGVASVSRLAEQVGLERSTLARNLKPLFEAGYVEDHAEPGCRDRQIAVTENGAVILDEALPLWESAQKDFKNALGGKNLKLFNRFLDKLDELEKPQCGQTPSQ